MGAYGLQSHIWNNNLKSLLLLAGFPLLLCLLGGVLGAQLGKGTGQLSAVGAGAVLGGLVGSSIGRSLAAVDKMKMHNTTQSALENQPDNATSRER